MNGNLHLDSDKPNLVSMQKFSTSMPAHLSNNTTKNFNVEDDLTITDVKDKSPAVKSDQPFKLQSPPNRRKMKTKVNSSVEILKMDTPKPLQQHDLQEVIKTFGEDSSASNDIMSSLIDSLDNDRHPNAAANAEEEQIGLAQSAREKLRKLKEEQQSQHQNRQDSSYNYPFNNSKPKKHKVDRILKDSRLGNLKSENLFTDPSNDLSNVIDLDSDHKSSVNRATKNVLTKTSMKEPSKKRVPKTAEEEYRELERQYLLELREVRTDLHKKGGTGPSTANSSNGHDSINVADHIQTETVPNDWIRKEEEKLLHEIERRQTNLRISRENSFTSTLSNGITPRKGSLDSNNNDIQKENISDGGNDYLLVLPKCRFCCI